jgi:hypothetical protein
VRNGIAGLAELTMDLVNMGMVEVVAAVDLSIGFENYGQSHLDKHHSDGDRPSVMVNLRINYSIPLC